MKILITLISSILLCACQSYDTITIHNNYHNAIRVQFSAPFEEDTTTYLLLAAQDTSVQSTAFVSNSDAQMELRAITVTFGANDKFAILRFSPSYLARHNWTLKVPFLLPDNEGYQKPFIADKVDAIQSHAYYHGVQELYNAGRYSDCLQAIRDASEMIQYSVDIVNRTPSRNDPRKTEILTEHKNFLLLAYLSAHKLHDRESKAYYSKELGIYANRWFQHLLETDLELSKL